jgi:hypothetical protein
MSSHILTIDNKEVFDFYEKHSLNFEQMNVLFCNILHTIITSTDKAFNQTMVDKLFENVNVIANKVNSIENIVNNQQTAVSSLLNLKFNDYRKECMSDLKLILTSNNIDHITPLIRETNANLIDKTTLIINELLPKNQESLSRDINSNFKLLQSTILNETSKFLSSSLDKKTIEDFLNSINLNMSQAHNTLTNLISSSETRIESKLEVNDSKMNEIKNIFSDNNNSQKLLQTSVTEMLKKFEKGIGKGSVSEHITYNILLTLFPCAQIDHVGDTKEMGDIILIRNGKPKILIENKDHDSCNVPKQDVEKFIRDCDIQKCCGIMLAQNRGIANKRNFEIQINNGNVLLYVHEVNFDVDKIKTSIEIVEQFKFKLDEININNDNNYVIEHDTLEEINKEFNSYILQKHTMLKLIRDFNEKMSSSVNELKMPCIEKFLSNNFATSSAQGDKICKYCEKYIPKSMSSHHRYCSSKKEFESTSTITPGIVISTEISTIATDIAAPTIVKVVKKGKNA